MAFTFTPYYFNWNNNNRFFCVSSDGKYWFFLGFLGSNCVRIITNDDTQTSLSLNSSLFLGASLIVPDGSGNTYLSASTDASVWNWYKVDSSGSMTPYTGTLAPGQGHAQRCAVNGLNVYYSYGTSLRRFSMSTKTTTVITANNGVDGEIAYDPVNARILMVNIGAGTGVLVDESTGNVLHSFTGLPVRYGTSANAQSSRVAYEPITKRFYIATDGGFNGTAVSALVSIDPLTYTVTDRSSIVSSITDLGDIEADGVGGLWISKYSTSASTVTVYRYINGILDSYSCSEYASGHDWTSSTGGETMKTLYDSVHNCMVVGAGNGCAISNAYPVPYPTVTAKPTTISGTSNIISVDGNVVNQGDSAVTEYGLCWKATDPPTISDAHSSFGSGSGSFTAAIDGQSVGLTEWSAYSFRAYATNSYGTSYSSTVKLYWGLPQTYPYNYTPIDLGYKAFETTSSHVANPTQGIVSGGQDGGMVGMGGGSVNFDAIPPNTGNSDFYGISDVTWAGQPTISAPIVGTKDFTFNTIFSIKKSVDTFSTINSCTVASLSGDAYSFAYRLAAVAGYNSEALGSYVWLPSGTTTTPTFFDFLNSNILFIGSRGGWANISPYNYSLFGNPVTNAIIFALVKTNVPSNITNVSASITGDSISDPFSSIENGFCWSSINSKPTLNDSSMITGGSLTGTITGLSAGVTHYVRSYIKVVNNLSQTIIAYGNAVSFATDNLLPIIDSTELINSDSIKVNCTITNQGTNTIQNRGICWSTNHNPTIADSKLDGSTGSGDYNYTATNLLADTRYYFRAYGQMTYGATTITWYSAETYEDTSIAVLDKIYHILGTNVLADCSITNLLGNSSIIQRGVCWSSVNTIPTISDSVTNDGTDIGNYTSNPSGLTILTHYYLRSYVTTTGGTSYSAEIGEFMTYISVPTVTTGMITGIGATSAIGSGSVLAEGDSPVSDSGLCWSPSGTPTISDGAVSLSSGLGSFTGTISSLFTGTKYYVRAYAANTYGVGYGGVSTFITTQPVRTNKILRRVLQNLKDTGQHEHKIDDDLIDRLNIIQDELCRDYFALKSVETLSLVAGQTVYTVDPTIYKIKQIYTPSGWREGVEIIHDSVRWNELLQRPHTYGHTVAYLWNGVLTLSKAPSVSIDTTMDCYMLPSTPILVNTDPELETKWDVALELGVTQIYDASYKPEYVEKASMQGNQDIKESIQGTQLIDYAERNIWE